ncbi:MAG: BamA/TamA family outer membrane protein [Fimbriimonadaceae bacterium]|nr:BamA/TamA family outer membrane protein [Chitinophagales bacterium]
MRFTQHNAQKYICICILSLYVIFFSACSNSIYLATNEYYYKETIVSITDTIELPPTLKNLSNNLEGLSTMEANKKLLGIYPLKLWLYNIGDTGIDMYVRNRSELDKRFLFFEFEKLVNNLNVLEPGSKFRTWLTDKAGEPPSLMDTDFVEDTKTRMENYLYNRGFFYPEVQYIIEYTEKNKRASAYYQVQLNTLYRMRTVTYDIHDKELKRIVSLIPDTSYLQPGNPIDVDYIKYERNRITGYLLNNGYYGFEKDYVFFEVDTSSGFDSLDVYVMISDPKEDSIHRRYRINNIYVYPDAERDYENAYMSLDTTFYSDKRSDYFIVSSNLDYKPRSLGDNIFINDSTIVKTDSTLKLEYKYYSINEFRQTVSAFSNLGIFKYVTYDIDEAYRDSIFRYLDVIIKLDPLPRKSVGYEFNASTTSDYLLGTSFNLSYTQKNLLHRLDQLKFNFYAGIESQVSSDLVSINTSELSGSVDLILPRLFWPFSFYIPKRYYPKTITSLAGNYINRLDFYELFNTSFSWGSQWIENSKDKQYTWNVVDINLVSVLNTTPDFDTLLQNNLLLLQSFQEQFIFGPTATWVYNSQLKKDKRNDIYFKASGEVAGMIYHAAAHWGEFSKNDTIIRTIAGIPYTNFTRFDLDFRDYYDFNSANKFVYRAGFSIAVPYWNSNKVVPYVKQFFAGGTNDIRAFPIRRLGPGSYFPYILNIEDSLTEVIPGDQSGDLKILMNFEYRFDIFSIFEGALFCDIGNIWTLHNDPYRPHSQFGNDFLDEIAIGPGAGLRLDAKFVIVRIDAAYPLKDPALDGPASDIHRVEFEEAGVPFPEKKIVWNIAIGYPF